MEILIVIGAILLIIYVIKKDKTPNIKTNLPEKYFRKSTTKHNYTYFTPLIKFNNKLIRRFEIQGMDYLNLKNNTIGMFKGYVVVEDNEYDEYAIAVYTNKNIHVGYLPGHNEKIFNIINNMENKSSFAFGLINSNKATKHFFGHVYVNMSLSKDKEKKLKELSALDLLSNDDLPNI